MPAYSNDPEDWAQAIQKTVETVIAGDRAAEERIAQRVAELTDDMYVQEKDVWALIHKYEDELKQVEYLIQGGSLSYRSWSIKNGEKGVLERIIKDLYELLA